MSLRTIQENATRRYGVSTEINALNEVVYRFYTPSHKGGLTYSLRCWKSKSGAYAALRANFPKRLRRGV